MSCLGRSGHELYPGYNENITEILGMTCPDGFQNWVPLSPYCYSLETSSYPLTLLHATRACQKLKSQLVLIDSKKLNDAYVKEIARKKPKHDTVRIGWKYGTN